MWVRAGPFEPFNPHEGDRDQSSDLGEEANENKNTNENLKAGENRGERPRYGRTIFSFHGVAQL